MVNKTNQEKLLKLEYDIFKTYTLQLFGLIIIFVVSRDKWIWLFQNLFHKLSFIITQTPEMRQQASVYTVNILTIITVIFAFVLESKWINRSNKLKEFYKK
jgi:hypothetical protein